MPILGHSQTADFRYESSDGKFCSPSTIQFTAITTGNPVGYVWTFGNNSGSNNRNPACTYAAAGDYTVKLMVIYKKSTIQVTKNIVINPAIAAHFNIDRQSLCAPGIIQFRSAVTVPIASYEWDFGDDSGIVYTNAPTITHHFSAFRPYNISMKAIAPTGCSGQSFTSVNIVRPGISGEVLPVTGCVPATASFRASVTLPTSSSVITYTWNFGDGSPEISTSNPNVNHTYQVAGHFIPTLRILTNDGCTGFYQYRDLTFGIPPVNTVAASDQQIICGSESPRFTAYAALANKYMWEFGESDTTYTNDTMIRHRFKQLGIKNIRVTPFYNDCPGTPASLSMNVIGVIAGFSYANTCSDKKQFELSNTTQGNISELTWLFGDGSPAETGRNIVHQYPDTGTFATSISVRDDITTCSDICQINIYTANPELKNPDSSICKNSQTSFIINRNYNNPSTSYEWAVLQNDAVSSSSAMHQIIALNHGFYNDNYVIIKNGPQYCPDTTRMEDQIIVRGPIPEFSSQSGICVGASFNVTNLSKPYIATDNITEWKWEYGIVSHYDNSFTPAPYLFPYWGTFPVKLFATDINGCSDSLVKQVTVADKPFLVHISSADTICAGNTVSIIAFHNDPITWMPANGVPCLTCDTIVVSPANSSMFLVTATNSQQCSKTDSIKIFVHPAFTASTLKPVVEICQQEKVTLDAYPLNTKIIWTPATGLSSSSIHKPVASPPQTTMYKALLTDSAGCFTDSLQVLVKVKPLPIADAGPNRTMPYYSAFSIMPAYSNDVRSYSWDPAHALDCGSCANVNGIASKTQTYTVTVTAQNGCISTDKVTIFVECNGANILLPTAFSPNNDNLNDFYYPITRGIKKVLRFTIYNRQGQKLFEATDIEPNQQFLGWDGKLKGADQPVSTYVYELICICDLGETIAKKGSFMLLR